MTVGRPLAVAGAVSLAATGAALGHPGHLHLGPFPDGALRPLDDLSQIHLLAAAACALALLPPRRVGTGLAVAVAGSTGGLALGRLSAAEAGLAPSLGLTLLVAGVAMSGWRPPALTATVLAAAAMAVAGLGAEPYAAAAAAGNGVSLAAGLVLLTLGLRWVRRRVSRWAPAVLGAWVAAAALLTGTLEGLTR